MVKVLNGMDGLVAIFPMHVSHGQQHEKGQCKE